MTDQVEKSALKDRLAWQDYRRKLQRSFFPSVTTGLFSLLLLILTLIIAYKFFRWAVVDATWQGDAETCRAAQGACWAFIGEKARFIFLGVYPRALDWQAVAASLLLVGLVVITAWPRNWSFKLAIAWPVLLIVAVAIMGGVFSGSPVPTQKWGGLPLTIMLTVVAFAVAFPLGIGLALARRSKMVIVAKLAIAFIEVMRGVPLIAVLYFSTLLLPLMLPGGDLIDKLLRAQIALVMFTSAYMAEIVRAGLQVVPRGQYEAAYALGLSWSKTMGLVVLPQALRTTIPAFVTLAIGIFLDTTLVTVIGLFDFLGTARAAATDSQWLGFYNEAYALIAVVYFTIAYSSSRYSLWLERYVTGFGHNNSKAAARA